MAMSLPFLIAALAQNHFMIFNAARVAKRFRPTPHIAPLLVDAPLQLQLQAPRGNDASVRLSGVPTLVDPSIPETWKPHAQAWRDGANGQRRQLSDMAPADTDATVPERRQRIDAARSQLFLQAARVLAFRARLHSQQHRKENSELSRIRNNPGNVRLLSSKRVRRRTAIHASLQAALSRLMVMMSKEDAERNLASGLGHLSMKVFGTGTRATLRAALNSARAGRTVMLTMEDEQSNQRLAEALFGDDAQDKLDLLADTSVSSHLKLEADTPLLRFVHVDEPDCIGCTYCAEVARSTFFMEEDAGRARVFAQGVDDPEVILEAIDCCPVNCISYVDLEDLVILESERDGLNGESAQFINQRSIGVGGDSFTNRRADSKVKGGSTLLMCNNCPSKGCKDCPMWGVGKNPVYLARLEEQEEKKAEKREAAREKLDAETKQAVSDLLEGTVSRDTKAEDKPLGDELDPCFVDIQSDECVDVLDNMFAGGEFEEFPTDYPGLDACIIDMESDECAEAMDSIFAAGYEVPEVPEAEAEAEEEADGKWIMGDDGRWR